MLVKREKMEYIICGMNTKALNYRILVEKEKQGKKDMYVAYAPSLGISDFGKTVDKAVSNIEKAMKVYIETLIRLAQPVPGPDAPDYFITTGKVELGKTFSHPT